MDMFKILYNFEFYIKLLCKLLQFKRKMVYNSCGDFIVITDNKKITLQTLIFSRECLNSEGAYMKI